MIRQVTNRIVIGNSKLDPATIKDEINMVVFLLSSKAESSAINRFINNGFFIKQHLVGSKDDARELAKQYSFVVSSGDNMLVICDNLDYTKEFVVDILNNTCGLAFGDGIDLFHKKLKV